MFSGCTVPPDSKETKLGSSNQEASLSAGKNTRVVLVPCPSLQLLLVWIFLRSLGVICYIRWLLGGVTKITSRIGVCFWYLLTQWIMAILSKGCNQITLNHITLKIDFANIWGLCFQFCESFLESNSHGVLTLCETNLDNSIDSGNFSVRDYLSLIIFQKDSIAHMHNQSHA